LYKGVNREKWWWGDSSDRENYIIEGLTWEYFKICVHQFSTFITNIWDDQLKKRKRWFWLTILEIPVHSWPHCFGWDTTWSWEHVTKHNCSPHSQKEKTEKAGDTRGPQTPSKLCPSYLTVSQEAPSLRGSITTNTTTLGTLTHGPLEDNPDVKYSILEKSKRTKVFGAWKPQTSWRQMRLRS
jgi:hypothetical protein